MEREPARRQPKRLTAALYRYRTEGGTPLRQALAVGLGLYIGASPFYGFHLLLAIALGGLFGLNRLKVYIAANISIPIIAPFLCALEIQVGSWLRRGAFYSTASLGDIQLRGLAADILIGSVVVGLVLAIAGSIGTYIVVSGRELPPRVAALLTAAAARYLPGGLWAWELSHGKLRMDPVYLQVLRDGVLPDGGTIVDVGCGRGLMLTLLAVAREQYRKGEWPESWPAPPLSSSLMGLERRATAAAKAREALGDDAVIQELDVTSAAIPPAKAILLFDVLQMMPREAQDRLLEHAVVALEPGGVLVIREADAAEGWRFSRVRLGNRIVAIVQGQPGRAFYFRTAEQWKARLGELGLAPTIARSPGVPRANFLLHAVKGSVTRA